MAVLCSVLKKGWLWIVLLLTHFRKLAAHLLFWNMNTFCASSTSTRERPCFCGYQLVLKIFVTKYYLPFVFDGKLGRNDNVVIVVSPLVSLMLHQVWSLRCRSVRAAIMSFGQIKVGKEFLATDDDIHECSLLFCAPEAIDTSKWRETFARADFLFAPFADVLGTTIIHIHRNIQQITNFKG